MNRKLLIVEDHRDCRTLLAMQAEAIGYDVIQAESGSIGIEKAVLEMPDLIVMDLRMNNVDGIEATRCIKNNPVTRNIPIIVYTAWTAPIRRRQALEAGAAMILTKPDASSLLSDMLRQFQS